MKILAINPPVEDFTAYNLWAMPLGLFRIMEYHAKLGDSVTYIDLLDGSYSGYEGAKAPHFRSWGRHSYWSHEIRKPSELKFVPRKYNRYGASEKRTEEILNSVEKPDLILVSTGMTYWYRTACSVIGMVRKIFPGVPVNVGGIAATLIPDVFVGEGVEVIKGKYLTDGEITGTDNKFINNLKFFPVNIVEGCPNRCGYCSSVIFNPEIRFMDIDKQVNSLEKWNKITGLQDVAFYDDALLLNNGKYLKDFLSRLNPHKYRFHTPNGLHLKELDEDLCKLMKKYDFPQLRFGFETAFTRFDNKTSVNQLGEKMELLRNSGFKSGEIGVYLLCGLPGQTVEEVEKTIDIVYEIGTRPYLSEFSPVPGTVLYNRHLAESLLDFDSEPLYQNNSVSAWRSPIFNAGVVSELKLKLAGLYSIMPVVN